MAAGQVSTLRQTTLKMLLIPDLIQCIIPCAVIFTKCYGLRGLVSSSQRAGTHLRVELLFLLILLLNFSISKV
jgi:hypothetical protein